MNYNFDDETLSMLGDTSTAMGNALYKNAKCYNPSITPDSSTKEKIESLPVNERLGLFQAIQTISGALFLSKAMEMITNTLKENRNEQQS